MRLNYQAVIQESEQELSELEKQHCYSHLNQRGKITVALNFSAESKIRP